MPHISSKKLDKDILEKLFNKLFSTFKQANKKESIPKMFDELFTDTEKIMFAKRLAIILMLNSNIPQHRIVMILKVSPSTVARMSLGIEIGKYKSIIKISLEEKMSLEKLIWNIMTAGGVMPPKSGKRNWLTRSL